MKESVQSARLRNQNKSYEAEHSANNAFVKRAQEAVAGMAGKTPSMGDECYHFNAHMTNTGEAAKEFGRKLTAGIDHKAFPVS